MHHDYSISLTTINTMTTIAHIVLPHNGLIDEGREQRSAMEEREKTWIKTDAMARYLEHKAGDIHRCAEQTER